MCSERSTSKNCVELGLTCVWEKSVKKKKNKPQELAEILVSHWNLYFCDLLVTVANLEFSAVGGVVFQFSK